MQVALYLTTLPTPRLYGVEITRVLDQDDLRVAAVKADVLITDTEFDPQAISVKYCCVLHVDGIEPFASQHGYACIDVAEIPKWFKRMFNIDVSRRARSSTIGAPSADSTLVAGKTESYGVKYKAMYESLIAELSRSDTYANLDPSDAKAYDVLLQAVRGTLRKADGVATELKTVQNKLANAESDVVRLTSEREIIDADIDILLSGLGKAVSDCTTVLSSISGLAQDTDLVEYSGVAVKARAAFGLSQKLTSVVDAKELRAIGSVCREFLSCFVSIAIELINTGTGAVKASANAQNVSHEAALAKASAEREKKQVNTLLEQEQAKVASLTQQLTALNDSYNQQVQRTTEAENQLLLSGSANIPALQEQVRALRIELQNKHEALLRLEEINNTAQDEDGGDSLPPEVATGIIRQLRTQVSSLKLERDRATAELMKEKKAAVRESERAETLANSARSLSQVALRGAQVSALPLFNYAAKALIIPVFGNGSTGITSAAVSLAKMLGVNSRTVLVDYDLVSTDLEGRFGERINPLIKLDGENDSGKNSAMGLFVDKGKDFFASHYSELVVRIDSNKAGILDYLPGFYAKPDLFMLTQADYTTLLNYLGARYDYIVIDAGKIGCSEIGDQILRNLCMCAFRSLIITDTSVEKARAMRLKLLDVFGTELRRIIERSVWLTNRSVTRMDLTRFTAPAMSVSVPVLYEMVGAHTSFHITHAAQREFNKVVRALAGV